MILKIVKIAAHLIRCVYINAGFLFVRLEVNGYEVACR